jgi:hypothetical protein
MYLELEDLQSITETLNLYEKGHADFDPDTLRRAFHDRAIIVGYYQGELTFESRDDYLQILTDVADDNDDQFDQGSGSLRLLSLDSTETTVVAKVESVISGDRYISQLTMIKIGAAWRIVSGVFHQVEDDWTQRLDLSD